MVDGIEAMEEGGFYTPDDLDAPLGNGDTLEERLDELDLNLDDMDTCTTDEMREKLGLTDEGDTCDTAGCPKDWMHRVDDQEYCFAHYQQYKRGETA